MKLEIRRDGDGVSVALPAAEGGGWLTLRHVMCIGRNYAEHAQEQGLKPPDCIVLFTKAPMSLALSGEDIVIPRICQDREQVDFEGELAVIIGRAARDVPPERALEHVLGYAPANDVSARWWQKEGAGGQFCRGKSFDTFCPIGPHVTPAGEVGDPQSLLLTTRVNGELMQRASTGAMTFSVATLVSELSRGTTLPAGTVILTGTPSGVGMSRKPPVYLRDGDTVEVEIEGLGVLRNSVRAER